MEYQGQVKNGGGLVRSQSESAAFPKSRHAMPPPTFLNHFNQVRVAPIGISPINSSRCCPSYLTKMRSYCQFFRLYLYNHHKLAIVVGVLSILAGIGTLVFSAGLSAVISWCMITGGAALVGGAIYHTASVALNCGLCRTERLIEDISDSELEESQ